MLTIRDTDKKFELVEFLERMILKNYNVDLANLSDENLLFVFTKEIYFDEKDLRNESTRDKIFPVFKSPASKPCSLKNKSFLNTR